MAITTFNLLVDNNPIEALLGRFRDKLLCQGNVLLSGETEAIDDALYLVFRILNAFRNLHLLFACQERHLTHLLEIHAHRVVEDIEFVLLLFLGHVTLLAATRQNTVHIRLINNAHLMFAKLSVNLIELLLVGLFSRQAFLNIIMREVALFLCQFHQFLDLIL